MNSKIFQAIEEKRLIAFFYNQLYRIVEPYTFGINTEGNNVLSAFQVGGDSESDNGSNWRLFLFEEIKDLDLLPTKFDIIRDGYKKGDSRMSVIYCEI